MDLTEAKNRAAQQLLGSGAFALWAAMVAAADDEGRFTATLNDFLSDNNFHIRTGNRYYKQLEKARGVNRTRRGWRGPSDYQVLTPNVKIRKSPGGED